MGSPPLYELFGCGQDLLALGLGFIAFDPPRRVNDGSAETLAATVGIDPPDHRVVLILQFVQLLEQGVGIGSRGAIDLDVVREDRLQLERGVDDDAEQPDPSDYGVEQFVRRVDRHGGTVRE